MPLEEARAIASAARARRVALLGALASGELAVEDLDADARAQDVKAVVIAESVPGVGKVQARRTLDALGVPGATLWGDIPRDRRAALVGALRADGARPADGS
jgi:hypothetical protein